MKTRDYKSFAPGVCYHLFNRGNGKMNIFKENSDYRFFLSRLEEFLFPDRRAPSTSRYERKSFPPGSFSLLSYCLMPNHYHFLLRQNGEVAVSALMLGLTGSYSKIFNKKYERVGSLFQDQFKAVPITSNSQLLWVSAYIHQNPKVAGLVAGPEEYPYSSYGEYLKSPILCDTQSVLGQFPRPEEYKRFVEDSFELIRDRKQLQKVAEGALPHLRSFLYSI